VVACGEGSLPGRTISSATPESAFSAFSAAWIGWEAYYGLHQPQTHGGFNVGGFALAEYQTTNIGWSGHYLAAQKDLSYAVLASGVYLGFGVILDLYAQPGYTNLQPLPYVFGDFGSHRVTLGYSKDAWNEFVPAGPFGYGFLASVAFYQQLLRVDTALNGGNTRLSGSINDNGDIAAAFTHRFGNAHIFGAMQYITASNLGLTAAILGAEYQLTERLLLFGAFTHLVLGSANIFQAGATYQVNDRVEISGGVERHISNYDLFTAISLGIQMGLFAQTVAYANYLLVRQHAGTNSEQFVFGVKSQF